MHRMRRPRALRRAPARCGERRACSPTCSTRPGCEFTRHFCCLLSVLHCYSRCQENSSLLGVQLTGSAARTLVDPSSSTPAPDLQISTPHAHPICRCATCAIDPSWLEVDNVDRRSGLSVAEFREQYEIPNKPVILTDVVRLRLPVGRNTSHAC